MQTSRRRIAGCFAAASLGFSGTAVRAEGVALTFDDLPQLALRDSSQYASETNRRLLAGLRRHHLRAVGFVIGDRLADDPAIRNVILNSWLTAGEELGNHTYDHEALNETPLPDYLRSIQRTDRVLRPLLLARGQRPRWFRHPYLETGASEDVREGIESWLKIHGYRVAPVTLENADWEFALPYDEAVLNRDDARAEEIRREYISYTAQIVPWYRKAALDLLGRRVPLVFLMHVSRINADTIDDLAMILHHNRLQATTLERVMKDPAYARSPGAPDKNGDQGLRRWADMADRQLPWGSLPAVPPNIVAANERLDTEP
jgi:peptidoglycan/xylan/chitin deacetylase (PgdA/CDA1 family)